MVRYLLALDAGVPFVAAIFPIAAVPAPQAGEAVDQFDAHDVLGLFVPQLSLDPETQGRAVTDAKVLAVHLVGEDGLRMNRVDEIDALVIAAASVERLFEFVGTMQDDISRRRLDAGKAQQMGERNASPLGDGAPAFDAVMAGDLGAGRKHLQISERNLSRPISKTVDLQSPVCEVTFQQSAYSSLSGALVPLTRKEGEMSFSSNSRASASRP